MSRRRNITKVHTLAAKRVPGYNETYSLRTEKDQLPANEIVVKGQRDDSFKGLGGRKSGVDVFGLPADRPVKHGGPPQPRWKGRVKFAKLPTPVSKRVRSYAANLKHDDPLFMKHDRLNQAVRQYFSRELRHAGALQQEPLYHGRATPGNVHLEISDEALDGMVELFQRALLTTEFGPGSVYFPTKTGKIKHRHSRLRRAGIDVQEARANGLILKAVLPDSELETLITKNNGQPLHDTIPVAVPLSFESKSQLNGINGESTNSDDVTKFKAMKIADINATGYDGQDMAIYKDMRGPVGLIRYQDTLRACSEWNGISGGDGVSETNTTAANQYATTIGVDTYCTVSTSLGTVNACTLGTVIPSNRVYPMNAASSFLAGLPTGVYFRYYIDEFGILTVPEQSNVPNPVKLCIGSLSSFRFVLSFTVNPNTGITGVRYQPLKEYHPLTGYMSLVTIGGSYGTVPPDCLGSGNNVSFMWDTASTTNFQANSVFRVLTYPGMIVLREVTSYGSAGAGGLYYFMPNSNSSSCFNRLIEKLQTLADVYVAFSPTLSILGESADAPQSKKLETDGWQILDNPHSYHEASKRRFEAFLNGNNGEATNGDDMPHKKSKKPLNMTNKNKKKGKGKGKSLPIFQQGIAMAAANLAKSINNKKKPKKPKTQSKSNFEVSGCAASFLAAIANPFSPAAMGACIPMPPSRPTQKVHAEFRLPFTIGASGYGYVCVAPTLANDQPGIWTTGLNFAGTTMLNYVDGTTPTLVAGVTATNFTNLPYSSSQLYNSSMNQSAANSVINGLVVAAGIRVSNTSVEQNLGGTIVCYVSAARDNICGTNLASMMNLVDSETNISTRKPCTAAIFANHDLEFTMDEYIRLRGKTIGSNGGKCNILYPLNGGFLQSPSDTTSCVGAPMMYIVVSGPVGNTYLVEGVIHNEYYGDSVMAFSTPKIADPEGVANVISAVDRGVSIKRAKKNTWQSALKEGIKIVAREAAPIALNALVSMIG